MVDQIEKFLRKLRQDEEVECRTLIRQIERGEIRILNTRKLKGYSNRFRIRKGKYRIIFEINKDKTIKIVSFGRRSESTYK